jgi:RND family efflux transporter MFP subunit
VNYRYVILLLALIALILVRRQFNRAPTLKTPPPPSQPVAGLARMVRVSQPIEKMVTDYEKFTGKTEAYQTAEVLARVSGTLDQVNIRPGAKVTKGNLLFEIDLKEYRAALEKAEKNYTLAADQVKKRNTDFQKALKRRDQDKISAKKFEKTGKAVAKAEAALQTADAARVKAHLDLELAQVKAPLGGIAGPHVAAKGTRVMADRTVMATIAQLDPIYVYFEIDQATCLRVEQRLREHHPDLDKPKGLPILLGLSGEKGFPHRGDIDLVDVRAPSKKGWMTVRAEFPNAGRKILPGQTARLRLPLGPPYRAFLVNPDVVVNEGKQNYLLIVGPGNQVEYRRVVLGPVDEGMQVIRTGLKPGEWVVVSGVRRVERGEVIEPRRVAMPVPAGRVKSP